MLLELADECKQHIWVFLDVQELCRVACVARNAEQGVCMGPIWQRQARTLLTKGRESLRTETGVLGCRLQRAFASRNLLAGEEKHQVAKTLHNDKEELVGIHDAIDWRLWCRDTHVVRATVRVTTVVLISNE